MINRRVNLFGDITGKSISVVRKQIMKYVDEEYSPISLCIDSTGGDLTAALSLVDLIAYLNKTYEVKFEIWASGECLSAAFLILLSGQKRLGSKSTIYMIHQASLNSTDMRADSVEGYLKVLNAIIESNMTNLLSTTKLSMEEFKKKTNSDWWFDSQTALKYEIIHEIF